MSGGRRADQELMRRAGLDVDVLDSGCCGLAGNFGMEQGHYEVSVAVSYIIFRRKARRRAELAAEEGVPA